jgi:hypothetical protein
MAYPHNHLALVAEKEFLMHPTTTEEEALQEVMAHAVAGHSERGSYHTFCSDPEHAKDTLAAAGFMLCEPITKGEAPYESDYGRPE